MSMLGAELGKLAFLGSRIDTSQRRGLESVERIEVPLTVKPAK